MRLILGFVLLVAASCTTTTISAPPPAQSQNPSASTQATKSARQGVRDYARVAARIRPMAVRICQEQNPRAPGSFCNFRIVVDDKDRGPPNAYQTGGKDGRPILAFNMAMLRTVQNDDEIAFILGHEAGHQIGNHISKVQNSASLGAVLLGSLASASGASATSVQDAIRLGGSLGARAFSQDHELEADKIGTYIAHLSGYNPIVGAQSFRRFAGGGFLSTHPAGQQRFVTVQNTMSQIRAGRPLRLN
jgi:Zn-dependent protease with chaperone function